MNNDFIFVYLNVVNDCFYGADFEIYSAYLRSYLKQKGVTSKQYINFCENTIYNIVNDLVDQLEYRIVFWVNEYNFYITKIVVNAIKEINLEKFLICIGPSTKYIFKNINEISFDYFSINEYQSLIDIVNNDLKFIKVNNDFNNKIFVDRKILASVPHPYSNGIIPAREIINVGLLTSKGCPGKCNFCSYTEQKDMIIFSVESIINELVYIRNELGNTEFILNFFDDCFSLSSDRIIELCNKIIENKFSYKFWCCTRYELMNSEVIKKMKEAGFVDTVVGLESGSKDIVSGLGKILPIHTSEEFYNKILEIENISKAENFHVIFSVNFGLLGEKLEDALETIDFLIMNKIRFISLNFMTIFPGSNLFNSKQIDDIVIKEGCTKLPLRTYYTNYNMIEIKKNLEKSKFKKVDYMTYNPIIHRNNIIEWVSGISYKKSDLYKEVIKYIKYDKFNHELIDFIKRFFPTNGVLLKEEERLHKTCKSLYGDNRKLLKYEISEFDRNLESFYHNNLYVENQYFINKTNNISVWINNYYQQFNQLKIHYMDSIKDKIHFVINNFNSFKLNNVYNVERIYKELFNDMCQFTGNCTTNCIPRISIKNNKIYLCDKRYLCDLNNYSDVLKKIKSFEGINKCKVLDLNDSKLLYDCINNQVGLVWYINILIFLFKNIDYLTFENEFYINTNINSNKLQELIRIFPEGSCIIQSNTICILYNAINHKSYICSYDEKTFINSIMKDKDINYIKNNNFIQKMCKRLT